MTVAEGASYVEWAPSPALRGLLACSWAARFADSGEPHVDRVLPDGCIDVLWMNGRLLVAGPDTTGAILPPSPGARIAGLRFRPGVAPAALRVAASALLDSRVDGRDVLGERAAPLEDELAAARSMREAAGVLTAHAERWLTETDPPDGLVQAAVVTLRAERPSPAVAAIAARLGVSERQLHRRFVASVGYGAKTLTRVLRLQRFVAYAATPGAPPLAQLARVAGYADQPHLSRECQELAGTTPAELVGYPAIAT